MLIGPHQDLNSDLYREVVAGFGKRCWVFLDIGNNYVFQLVW